MKKKWIIITILKISPVLLILASFFIIDPFGLFSSSVSRKQTHILEGSSDYITIKKYLAQTDTVNYDSFIFGNSKTLAFQGSEWSKYLNHAAYYSISAPGDNISNILKKMKLIEKNGDTLKNALLILDQHILYPDYFKSSNAGPVFIHHPQSSDNSWVSFYGDFLKVYVSNWCFVKCIDYSLFHQYRPYMDGVIKRVDEVSRQIEFERSNEFYLTENEKEIARDSVAFFTSPNRRFYDQRKNADLKMKISSSYISYLQEIADLFSKNKTNYRIVFGPNYDQQRLNKSDYDLICSIFKKEFVFDYTGVNEFTSNRGNYYESSHYRPIVGSQLLKLIYQKSIIN